MISIRHTFALSIAIALASIATDTAVFAQSDAVFGTRNIQVCSPVTSKPSLEEAAKLVQCGRESKTARDMVLLENVHVQMGGGQPYNFQAHSRLTGVDTTSEIYPIRGSYTYFDCSRISVMPIIHSDNTGKNCFSVSQPNATGYCWQTTFGDWQCSMIDTTHNDVVENQPPPQ